jgi:hypothetical protein
VLFAHHFRRLRNSSGLSRHAGKCAAIPLKPLLLATLHPAGFGCSTEAWKRAGYEALQNIHQQQCEKNFSLDCEERKSYEAYRREVDGLETD